MTTRNTLPGTVVRPLSRRSRSPMSSETVMSTPAATNRSDRTRRSWPGRQPPTSRASTPRPVTRTWTRSLIRSCVLASPRLAAMGRPTATPRAIARIAVASHPATIAGVTAGRVGPVMGCSWGFEVVSTRSRMRRVDRPPVVADGPRPIVARGYGACLSHDRGGWQPRSLPRDTAGATRAPAGSSERAPLRGPQAPPVDAAGGPVAPCAIGYTDVSTVGPRRISTRDRAMIHRASARPPARVAR